MFVAMYLLTACPFALHFLSCYNQRCCLGSYLWLKMFSTFEAYIINPLSHIYRLLINCRLKDSAHLTNTYMALKIVIYLALFFMLRENFQ